MKHSKQSRIAIIAVIVIFLLFTSSCGYVGGGKTNRPQNENYRVGSQGLEMRFMTNMPPYKLYDNEKLPVGIELYNRGATDLQSSNARLYVSGFDTSIITGIYTSGKQIDELEGKSMYNSEGGYTTVVFDGYITSLDARNVDSYNPTLLATACYRYETIADPMVCVDFDPYSPTQQDKVCNAETVTNLGGTQGAPIAVSSVQVEPSRGKMRFKIYVNNVGAGLVYKDGYDYLNRCSPYNQQGLDYNDINFVRVEEVSIGTTSILASCKPLENGYLRLKDSGSGYMLCEYSGAIGPAYTTPLRIKLTYNYRTSIKKSIEIVQSP